MIDKGKWTIEENSKEDKNYIEQFFVSLLEGNRTITTNLSNNKKRIIVRFTITLKNKKNNQIILNKIQKVIEDKVIIERKDKYITWIANSKADINKILLILS